MFFIPLDKRIVADLTIDHNFLPLRVEARAVWQFSDFVLSYWPNIKGRKVPNMTEVASLAALLSIFGSDVPAATLA